jgi:hypothetical protein
MILWREAESLQKKIKTEAAENSNKINELEQRL